MFQKIFISLDHEVNPNNYTVGISAKFQFNFSGLQCFLTVTCIGIIKSLNQISRSSNAVFDLL